MANNLTTWKREVTTIRYFTELPALSLLAIAVVLIFSSGLLAGSEDVAKSQFVDLDGDGFDDNAADNDGDGIPDDVGAQAEDNTVDTGLSEFDDVFSSDLLEVEAPEVFISNSEYFCRLRMVNTALSHNRVCFSSGDDFGPGSGIGSGAVLGGVCAGGVCVPH